MWAHVSLGLTEDAVALLTALIFVASAAKGVSATPLAFADIVGSVGRLLEWGAEFIHSPFVALAVAPLHFFVPKAHAPAGQPGDPAIMNWRGESVAAAKPLLFLFILIGAIGATGLELYRMYDRETRQDAQDLVSAVARQKAQALEIWLDGRRSATNPLRTAPLLRDSLAKLVALHDANALPVIRQILDPKRLGTDTVLALDVEGLPLVSVGTMDQVSAELRQRVRAAAASGATQSHFLHRDPDLPGSPIFLDYLVPLTAQEDSTRPIAVLVLRHEPERFFFPLIQTWPGPSESAETLLVRREGDKVMFLNALRHQDGTAFRLTRPRTELTLPAVQAVFGLPRLEHNFDYRGIEVVADHHPIGGTDWHLLAKIDTAEILHGKKLAVMLALSVTLALILAAGTGAIVFWRQQLRLFAANLRARELEREALSKHLDLMSRYANDAIFLYDETGHILEANQRAIERYGYTRDELIGMSANRLHAPGAAHKAREEAKQSNQEGSRVYETRHRRNDGSEFPVEASPRSFDLEGKRFTQEVIRDITERMRAEARILRLTTLKDALSRVGHAIVHARDEQPLFEEICTILVERAGFDYVGIRIADLESGETPTVAGAGASAAAIALARTTVRADQPEGRGLTGTAIRGRRHVVSQDFLADPSTAPWHEIARTVGIESAATFPIMRAAVAVGVINVLSRARQAFDDEVVALLDEAAQDVSFALDNLDRERARRKAEARSIELQSIVNRSPAVFFKWNRDKEPSVELVSDNIAEFGYAPDDLLSGRLKYTDIVHPDDRARFVDERRRAEQEGRALVVREYRILTHDGHVRWIEDRTWPQRNPEGAITHYQGLIQDVTARKLAETELRAAEEQFRSLVEQSISGIWIIQDGRIAYANPRIGEIFGYASPDELVGREALEMVAEKDHALVTENVRRRMDGEVKSIAYSVTGLRKDGTPVEIGGEGTLASFHGRPAIIGVLQDITERKRSAEAAERHLEELRQAMMATVHVASTIGEMRDPYTSGHERRVGELAAAIGAELGLSGHAVEGLRVAGYLHDIGKINVPSEILAKPGKISPVEFALIKEHAQHGYEILREVKFPWPVALVALQHHERADGTGYPNGLKGDAIMLEARILAVADTMEAMSSHRPYRPGRGIDAALAEIEYRRGTRYDPQAVDACLRLFREKGYHLPD